jgi:MFS family permease
MRKVFLLVGAIVFVDTAFYAAIVPLLPHYVEDLHLSQTAAGVLTASYAAGTLLASLPGGVCAARFGVKPTVLTGLSLLAGSSLVFGFGQSAAVLDAARFAQGVGGAFSWAGGFAWLMGVTPIERRGEVAGSVIAAAVFGVVAGPVVGAAAVELGAREVFGAVALTAMALFAWSVRVPAGPPSGQGISGLARANRAVWVGVALFALPSAFVGAIDVLLPLRLDALGAGAVLIAAIFLAAAVVEGTITPFVGRLSDRRGRLVPISIGLTASAALGALLPLISSLGLLLVGTVAIIAALAMFWAPASAMLSEESEAIGMDQGLAGALMNLAWAGGQVLGGSLGGALADAAGDGSAYAVLVCACVVSLAFVVRRRRALVTT